MTVCLLKSIVMCLIRTKFFKTDSGFTHVYYNPDATAGRTAVYNEISSALIWDALADDMSYGSFFEYLGSECKAISCGYGN